MVRVSKPASPGLTLMRGHRMDACGLRTSRLSVPNAFSPYWKGAASYLPIWSAPPSRSVTAAMANSRPRHSRRGTWRSGVGVAIGSRLTGRVDAPPAAVVVESAEADDLVPWASRRRPAGGVGPARINAIIDC
jgi:hypothetical protein